MSPIDTIGATPNIMQSARSTIDRAVRAATRDAATVASAPANPTVDLVAALIDARQQVLYTQAGARMIETADQMMGALLDVRA